MSALTPRITPHQFVAKWKRADLKERSAAQEHFIDLCHLLGQPTPAEADPKGEFYCFERGASKVGGGEGWADVWLRKHFGWEYKGKRKDLDAALLQLQRYAPALENPPLLIVSDLDRIRLHTNWTNTVPVKYEIPLDGLTEPANLQTLKSAFTDPDALRPQLTTAAVTEAAAGRFADLAKKLRARGHEAQRVAHFLNRLMFCLFAEDAKLLPGKLLTQALEGSLNRPQAAQGFMSQLFGAMHKGGDVAFQHIEWFNGGLFDNDEALPLQREDIEEILDVSKLDWAWIEPSIFGTLFERGLDPGNRTALGAHYTDPKSIMRVVNPVIVEPLLHEWNASKDRIKEALAGADKSKSAATKKKYTVAAQQEFQVFMKRLADYRVLDPACGSGNFLYLALQALKDIEHRASLEAEQLGLGREFTGMNVGVQCLHGIEVNGYAAELARVTVWIGEIQWMLRHGVPPSKDPILKPLNTVECRDAILNPDGTEPAWPRVDAIIGNPPFLGTKKQFSALGRTYTEQLRKQYKGRVPGFADLVCYWFEKARAAVVAGHATSAGLVATNSIRGGANRAVLDKIVESCQIVEAWGDEPWVNDGANVRVSIVAYANKAAGRSLRLDGLNVPSINADLTSGADLASARQLRENQGVAFVATVKAGPFDVPGDVARKWLALPNPNGRPNSDVLKPWWNGLDVTRRPSDTWIIDFGVGMPDDEAAQYEEPFRHVLNEVKKQREASALSTTYKRWWLMARPIPAMRDALRGLARYIAVPALSKHRVFVWIDGRVLPDHQLIVFARDDDVSFGILHSRFHEVWSIRLGTSLEDRPRYTPTTSFETFPFPSGLAPNVKPEGYTSPFAANVAAAAANLAELRGNWLNPQGWVDRNPEVVPGYPDRVVPKPEHTTELKKRTLTNLYNAMPTWLQNAHAKLDEAVAKAYGWTDYTKDMPDEEVLRRLLALNLERAGRS